MWNRLVRSITSKYGYLIVHGGSVTSSLAFIKMMEMQRTWSCSGVKEFMKHMNSPGVIGHRPNVRVSVFGFGRPVQLWHKVINIWLAWTMNSDDLVHTIYNFSMIEIGICRMVDLVVLSRGWHYQAKFVVFMSDRLQRSTLHSVYTEVTYE